MSNCGKNKNEVLRAVASLIQKNSDTVIQEVCKELSEFKSFDDLSQEDKELASSELTDLLDGEYYTGEDVSHLVKIVHDIFTADELTRTNLIKDYSKRKLSPISEEVVDTTSSFLSKIFGVKDTYLKVFEQEVKSELITLTLWDRNNKKIINSVSQIQSNINNYIKALMQIIDPEQELNDIYYEDFFKTLQDKAENDEFIKDLLNIGTENTNSTFVTNALNNLALENSQKIKAFIKLKYLDNLINITLNGFISINPEKFCTYDLSGEGGKYTYSTKANITFANNDDLIDIEKNTEVVVKLLKESMNLYNYEGDHTSGYDILANNLQLDLYKKSIISFKNLALALSNITVNGVKDPTANVCVLDKNSKLYDKLKAPTNAFFSDNERAVLTKILDESASTPTVGDLLNVAQAKYPKLLYKTVMYCLFTNLGGGNNIFKYLCSSSSSYSSKYGLLSEIDKNLIYSLYRNIFDIDANSGSLISCEANSTVNAFTDGFSVVDSIILDMVSTGSVPVGGYEEKDGVLTKYEYSIKSDYNLRRRHEQNINTLNAVTFVDSFQDLLHNVGIEEGEFKVETSDRTITLNLGNGIQFTYNSKSDSYEIHVNNSKGSGHSEDNNNLIFNNPKFQDLSLMLLGGIPLKDNPKLREAFSQEINSSFLQLIGKLLANSYDLLAGVKEGKHVQNRLTTLTFSKDSINNITKIVTNNCLEDLDRVVAIIKLNDLTSLNIVNKDAEGNSMNDTVLSNKLANLRTNASMAKLFYKESPINNLSIINNGMFVNATISRDIKGKDGAVKKITETSAKELFAASFLADYLGGLTGDENSYVRSSANGRRLGFLAGVFSDKPAITHFYLDIKEKGFPIYNVKGELKETISIEELYNNTKYDTNELLKLALYNELGNYYRTAVTNINNNLVKALTVCGETIKESTMVSSITETLGKVATSKDIVYNYSTLVQFFKKNSDTFNNVLKEYNQAHLNNIIQITDIIDDKLNNSLIHELNKYSNYDTFKKVLQLHEAAFLVSMVKADVQINTTQSLRTTSDGLTYLNSKYSGWDGSYNIMSETPCNLKYKINGGRKTFQCQITPKLLKYIGLDIDTNTITDPNTVITADLTEELFNKLKNCYVITRNGQTYGITAYENLIEESNNTVFMGNASFNLSNYELSQLMSYKTDASAENSLLIKYEGKDFHVTQKGAKYLRTISKYKEKKEAKAVENANHSILKINKDGGIDTKEINEETLLYYLKKSHEVISNGKMTLAKIEYSDKNGHTHMVAISNKTDFNNFLKFISRGLDILSNPSLLLDIVDDIKITLHPELTSFNLFSTYVQLEMSLIEVGTWAAHPDKGSISFKDTLKSYLKNKTEYNEETQVFNYENELKKLYVKIFGNEALTKKVEVADSDAQTEEIKSTETLETELQDYLTKNSYNPKLQIHSDPALNKSLNNFMLSFYEAVAAFREKALEKRNVIYTALKKLLLLDLVNGLPSNIKYALLEDINVKCYTPAGDMGKATPFDGATFSHPVLHILFNNSLNAAKVGTDLKGFSSFYDYLKGVGGIMKTANFAITNELMRKNEFYRTMCFNMLRHRWKTENGEDWYIPKDRTYGVFTGISNKNATLRNSLFPSACYYSLNGKYFKREFRSFDANTLIYIFDDFEVSKDGTPINTKPEEAKLEITDNFSVFDALGGWNRVSFNSSNELVFSEDSIIDLSQIMIQNVENDPEDVSKVTYKHQVYLPLLHSDIMFGITQGAVKFGGCNLNKTSVYTDAVTSLEEGRKKYNKSSNYNYAYMNVDDLGPQLDKEHHADESEIANMTLVISAAASRGFTPWDCMELYEALASISVENTKAFRNLDKSIFSINNTTLPIFLEILMKLVCKYLLNNLNENSKLKDLTLDLIDELKKNGLVLSEKLKTQFRETIPLSHPSIYNQIFSILSTTLTKSGIKTKVGGSLSVLNPTHSIIKYYNKPINTPLYFSVDWIDSWKKAVELIQKEDAFTDKENTIRKLYNYALDKELIDFNDFLLNEQSISSEILYKKVQANELPQIAMKDTTCMSSSTEFMEIVDDLLDIITDIQDVNIGSNYEIIPNIEDADFFKAASLALHPSLSEEQYNNNSEQYDAEIKKLLGKDKKKYWANVMLPNNKIEGKNIVGREFLKKLLNSGVVHLKSYASSGNDLKSYDVKGTYTDSNGVEKRFSLADLDSVQTLCEVKSLKSDDIDTRIRLITEHLYKIGALDAFKAKLRYDYKNLMKLEDSFLEESSSKEEGNLLDEEPLAPTELKTSKVPSLYVTISQRLLGEYSLDKDDSPSALGSTLDSSISNFSEVLDAAIRELLSSKSMQSFSVSGLRIEHIKDTYMLYFNDLAIRFMEKVFLDDLFRISPEEDIAGASGRLYINGEEAKINKDSLTTQKYGAIVPKVNKSDLGLPEDCLPEDVKQDPKYFENLLLAHQVNTVQDTKVKFWDPDFCEYVENTISLWDLELKRADGKHVYVGRSNIKYSNLLKNTDYYKVFDSESDSWVMKSIQTNEIVYYLHSKNDEVYVLDNGCDLIISTEEPFHFNGNPCFEGEGVTMDNIVSNVYEWYLNHVNHVGFSLNSNPEVYEDNLKFEMINHALLNNKKDAKLWKELSAQASLYEGLFKDNMISIVAPVLMDVANYFEEFNGQDKIEQIIKKSIREQAESLRNSFLLSLNIIAARIPAQCLQSVMAMEVEGFVDADLNKAFVSIYQFFLQGSDLDIDAVSLQMYSFMNDGSFPSISPYYNISSEAFRKVSSKMPLPKINKALTTSSDGASVKNLISEFSKEQDKFPNYDLWKAYYMLISHEGSAVQEVLTRVEELYQDGLSKNAIVEGTGRLNGLRELNKRGLLSANDAALILIVLDSFSEKIDSGDIYKLCSYLKAKRIAREDSNIDWDDYNNYQENDIDAPFVIYTIEHKSKAGVTNERHLKLDISSPKKLEKFIKFLYKFNLQLNDNFTINENSEFAEEFLNIINPHLTYLSSDKVKISPKVGDANLTYDKVLEGYYLVADSKNGFENISEPFIIINNKVILNTKNEKAKKNFRKFMNKFKNNPLISINNGTTKEAIDSEKSIVYSFLNIVNKALSHKVKSSKYIDLAYKNHELTKLLNISENVVHGYESISSIDIITDPVKNLAKKSESARDLAFYYVGNLMGQFIGIETNMAGKTGIASCAVAEKTLFAFTAVTLFILQQGNPELKKTLLWGIPQLNKVFNGKIAGLTKHILANSMSADYYNKNYANYLNNIANQETFKLIKDFLDSSLNNFDLQKLIDVLLMHLIEQERFTPDSALVISALLSLATDNAKELVLEKINAGPETIDLYLAGAAMGYNIETLHDIINSKYGREISKFIKSDIITGNPGQFSAFWATKSFEQIFNSLLGLYKSYINRNWFKRDALDTAQLTLEYQIRKKLDKLEILPKAILQTALENEEELKKIKSKDANSEEALLKKLLSYDNVLKYDPISGYKIIMKLQQKEWQLSKGNALLVLENTYAFCKAAESLGFSKQSFENLISNEESIQSIFNRLNWASATKRESVLKYLNANKTNYSVKSFLNSDNRYALQFSDFLLELLEDLLQELNSLRKSIGYTNLYKLLQGGSYEYLEIPAMEYDSKGLETLGTIVSNVLDPSYSVYQGQKNKLVYDVQKIYDDINTRLESIKFKYLTTSAYNIYAGYNKALSFNMLALAADEFKRAGSMFGLNKELKVKESESRAQLNKFEEAFINQIKTISSTEDLPDIVKLVSTHARNAETKEILLNNYLKFPEGSNDPSTSVDGPSPAGIRLDVSKFLNDEEYRIKCVLFYDKIKTWLNLLDPFATDPHWRSYLEALATLHNLKRTTVMDILNKHVGESFINKYKVKDDKAKQQVYSNLSKTYQWRSIRSFLHADEYVKKTIYLPQKKFLCTSANLNLISKDADLSESDKKILFNLSTSAGQINFINYMNMEVIPSLKLNEKYKDNYFVENLGFRNILNKMSGFTIAHQAPTLETLMPSAKNVEESQKVERLKEEFCKLINLNLPNLLSVDGEQVRFSVADAFYVYGLLTTGGNPGPLSIMQIMTMYEAVDGTLGHRFNKYLALQESNYIKDYYLNNGQISTNSTQKSDLEKLIDELKTQYQEDIAPLCYSNNPEKNGTFFKMMDSNTGQLFVIKKLPPKKSNNVSPDLEEAYAEALMELAMLQAEAEAERLERMAEMSDEEIEAMLRNELNKGISLRNNLIKTPSVLNHTFKNVTFGSFNNIEDMEIKTLKDTEFNKIEPYIFSKTQRNSVVISLGNNGENIISAVYQKREYAEDSNFVKNLLDNIAKVRYYYKCSESENKDKFIEKFIESNSKAFTKCFNNCINCSNTQGMLRNLILSYVLDDEINQCK